MIGRICEPHRRHEEQKNQSERRIDAIRWFEFIWLLVQDRVNFIADTNVFSQRPHIAMVTAVLDDACSPPEPGFGVVFWPFLPFLGAFDFFFYLHVITGSNQFGPVLDATMRKTNVLSHRRSSTQKQGGASLTNE